MQLSDFHAVSCSIPDFSKCDDYSVLESAHILEIQVKAITYTQGFHSCRFSKAGFQIPAPAKPAESLLSLLKSLLLLLKHLIFRRFQNYHFLIFYFEISGPELFKIIIFGLSHHFLDKTSPILV